MSPHAIRLAAAALASAVAVLTAAAQPSPVPPQPPPVSAAAVKTLTRYAAADKYPLKHDAKKAEQALRDRVAWFVAGGLKVYLKTAAPTDPGYDATRAALERVAVVRAQTDLTGAPAEATVSRATRRVSRIGAAPSTRRPRTTFSRRTPGRMGTP